MDIHVIKMPDLGEGSSTSITLMASLVGLLSSNCGGLYTTRLPT